ncbi:putative FAD-linked oxidoreductase [Escovopsis weberi]|uniref:Putative FAD-linked oxidoreductase n=1 Tax=Escovopsis weberi TaxID=150374 RepID=A0A0M8N0P5_ESCWE|nr:putative FAD-linked oxidoreductase [Escovopsis weberi]
MKYSFLAYSALNDSLVIDISHIDHVNMAEEKLSAKVGAGIRLGPLYTVLAAAGRDWPGGICPTVGLSGFLGAGGFNMQMRQTGLGIDHVLSAEVVLADGRTVTASADENPDLFWAIRGGGGGTYGIVVEWTLRLSAFPRSAMVLINWNDPNTTADVANKWIGWAPDTDKALTTQLNVKTNTSQLIGWCYGCSVDKARALVDASGLLAIGTPQVFISGNCSSENARMIGFGANECMPDEQVAKLAPLALNYPQQPFARIANASQFAWGQTLQDPSAPAAQPWPRIVRISKSFFLQRSRRPAPDHIADVVRRIQALPPAASVWGEWHSWNIAGNASSSAFAWRDEAYAHLEFIVTGSTDKQVEDGYLAWAEDLENYLRPVVG